MVVFHSKQIYRNFQYLCKASINCTFVTEVKDLYGVDADYFPDHELAIKQTPAYFPG